jgi:hypothetical protein
LAPSLGGRCLEGRRSDPGRPGTDPFSFSLNLKRSWFWQSDLSWFDLLCSIPSQA